jgi:hypothetical protein
MVFMRSECNRSRDADKPAPLVYCAGMKPELLWPLAIVTLVLYLVTRIRYVVDDAHVRVKIFGATLRKIALADIEFADTESPFWNEHWCNTYWPWGRVVRLRRKSGWVRNFIITPADRDVFLSTLNDKLKARVEMPVMR